MTMDNLTSVTISELLQFHGAVIDELKRRGVVRSKNNPTGDYAEWLAATRLGLMLESNSAKGFDATDSQGLRYQIKGRRVTLDNPSTQLGVIRNLEEKDFDFLLAVIFDADWRVLRAARIPHRTVENLATFRKHQNGHIMHLRPAVLGIPDVEDITDILTGLPMGDQLPQNSTRIALEPLPTAKLCNKKTGVKVRTIEASILNWQCKPETIVHKVIGKVASHIGGISKADLTAWIGDELKGKNPSGTINSMLTDKGNAYGKVLVTKDGVIAIHPEVRELVCSLSWGN